MAKKHSEFIPQDGMTLKEVLIGLNKPLRAYHNKEGMINILQVGKYRLYLNASMTASYKFKKISIKELKTLVKDEIIIAEQNRENSFWLNRPMETLDYSGL